jgi:cation transport ATPase
MNAALAGDPEVVHAVRGRVRVHLPGWSGWGQRRLESHLRELQGVLSASANAFTGNVLVRFEPSQVNVTDILAAARDALQEVLDTPLEDRSLPHALHEPAEHKGRARARITVRGIDCDPAVARAAVERLGRRPGVLRVSVSTLTGRVLVEYNRHETTIEDLLADVAHVELPDVAGEDRPAHPLDPGPLFDSLTRSIGAGLGFGILALNQLTGWQPSQGLRLNAARAAAAIGIVQGIPGARQGLRRLLGHAAGDLIFYAPSIVLLTLSGSPLGLAVTGAESLRLLTEVLARRTAWRRYEERLETQPHAHPGAVVRLEAGQRTPLPCTVIEGFGTAIGRDGLPQPVSPGEELAAGSRFYGGPLVVELQGGEGFVPQSRPAPSAPSLADQYMRVVGAASLAYATLTALLTRSLSRAFQALLLVNARPALIGVEMADTGASARILRAGVTVVGTRPDRPVRRPGYLLLDGPRTLTDGFEIAGVIPLDGQPDGSELVSVVSAIAAAAGSPWRGAIVRPGGMEAVDGHLDGHTASARIGDVRYALGPPRPGEVPASAYRSHEGRHLLVLRSERQRRPLGIVALRARLLPGITDLVETCRRHGVGVELLGAGDRAVCREVGLRAGIPVTFESDPIELIRTLQAAGSVVAFASDSPDARAAFAASDLAIGMTSGRSNHFPARADLLAPDLIALAAIVETGARREAAMRDYVVLSAVSNIVGVAWGLRGEVGVLRASYGVYAAALATIADG